MNISSEHIVAIGTLCGVIFSAVMATMAAYFQMRAKRDLAEVNDAVNHRTEKHGDKALKLYDLVWENHEKTDELIGWKRGYDESPLATGKQVIAYVRDTDTRVERLEKQFDQLYDVLSGFTCPLSVGIAAQQTTHRDLRKRLGCAEECPHYDEEELDDGADTDES